MESYELLERKLANWIGTDYCESSNVVAVSSGTAALHLALEALRLPLGSEVIIPDFTMIACARAVTLAGLTPVFADCYEDMTISLSSIRSLINRNTSAIMAVHIYGRRCKMEEINQLANYYKLRVIEDLAEAHGVKVHPLTDAACWSFYKNKIVAGEEGGAIAFRFFHQADYGRSLRSLGFYPAHDFKHHPRGHNYRLANCLAEKILKSLDEVDDNLAERRRIEEAYIEVTPKEWRLPARDVVWVYDLAIPGMTPTTQNRLIRALHKEGYGGARHGFKPMRKQPEYDREYVEDVDRMSDRRSREVIYLPCSLGVTEEEIKGAIGVIRGVMRDYERPAKLSS